MSGARSSTRQPERFGRWQPSSTELGLHHTLAHPPATKVVGGADGGGGSLDDALQVWFEEPGSRWVVTGSSNMHSAAVVQLEAQEEDEGTVKHQGAR